MSIALTLENKNNLSIDMENRITSPAWNDVDKSWDEMDETWDSQGTPIFSLENKNNLSLTLENK